MQRTIFMCVYAQESMTGSLSYSPKNPQTKH